jgi:hypothetical protein
MPTFNSSLFSSWVYTLNKMRLHLIEQCANNAYYIAKRINDSYAYDCMELIWLQIFLFIETELKSKETGKLLLKHSSKKLRSSGSEMEHGKKTYLPTKT